MHGEAGLISLEVGSLGLGCDPGNVRLFIENRKASAEELVINSLPSHHSAFFVLLLRKIQLIPS